MVYQIGALDALARTVGSSVTYVKPHGALYNTIVHHEVQADAVARAVRDANAAFPVLTLPRSAFGDRARELGLRVVTEAFADRAYREDGTLVPRGEPGAVLHDPAAVAARIPALSKTAESICVHGDSPDAVTIARTVRAALTANAIELAPSANTFRRIVG
ncbi:LamB/YcsF family protein [Mycobacteroides abscessus subsp. massiliense]|nr:LamB/YcsF family protein [Mycobacteroides abscessus subsp. massiliense]